MVGEKEATVTLSWNVWHCRATNHVLVSSLVSAWLVIRRSWVQIPAGSWVFSGSLIMTWHWWKLVVFPSFRLFVNLTSIVNILRIEFKPRQWLGCTCRQGTYVQHAKHVTLKLRLDQSTEATKPPRCKTESKSIYMYVQCECSCHDLVIMEHNSSMVNYRIMPLKNIFTLTLVHLWRGSIEAAV